MKLSKKSIKKFNRIRKVVKIDKLFRNRQYYFDNGQVLEMVDIIKENVKYTIIKLNTNVKIKEYLVFVIIRINDKVISYQLKRTFNCAIDTDEYFKYLYNYIENSSINEIIDICYQELSCFSRKNFIVKLFGI